MRIATQRKIKCKLVFILKKLPMKSTFYLLKSGLVLLVTTLFFNSCNLNSSNSIDSKAQELAQNNIIIDTHIDMPNWLFEEFDNISALTETGDFDYNKAKKGGLNAPFMAVFVSPDYEGMPEGKVRADHQIDLIEDLVSKNPEKLAFARSPEDVKNNFKNNLLSLPLGLENGAPLLGDLENLHHFYNRGIRYITIVHGKCNHICDSSYDSIRVWNGLSQFGEELIAEMNKIGMIVDVSHASDSSFYHLMKITKAPVAATHSGVRFYTPGFERNLTDEMIKMIADKEGIIQIPFGSGFLTLESREYRNKYKLAFDKYLEENGFKRDAPEAVAFTKEYYKNKPYPYASIDNVLDHIDHVVNLVGVNYVGFGSDFEGVGDSLPKGLKNVSGYPNLIAGLINRGYNDEDIKKIMGLNFLNFWSRVQSFASQKPS